MHALNPTTLRCSLADASDHRDDAESSGRLTYMYLTNTTLAAPMAAPQPTLQTTVSIDNLLVGPRKRKLIERFGQQEEEAVEGLDGQDQQEHEQEREQEGIPGEPKGQQAEEQDYVEEDELGELQASFYFVNL